MSSRRAATLGRPRPEGSLLLIRPITASSAQLHSRGTCGASAADAVHTIRGMSGDASIYSPKSSKTHHDKLNPYRTAPKRVTCNTSENAASWHKLPTTGMKVMLGGGWGPGRVDAELHESSEPQRQLLLSLQAQQHCQLSAPECRLTDRGHM